MNETLTIVLLNAIIDRIRVVPTTYVASCDLPVEVIAVIGIPVSWVDVAHLVMGASRTV